MPMIYETDTSTLARAAGNASDVFRQYQDRADRLRSQAANEDLAQQQLDLSKQRLELSQKQFEQAGGIAERGFNQDEADARFFRDLAVQNGAAPEEVAGMSVQGARQAANVLMTMNRFRQSAESVATLADSVFASLGLEGGGGDVQAPGVESLDQQAASPQRQLIMSMIESAESVDDLEKVRGVLYGMVQAKHEGVLEMQQRMQSAQLLTPMVETMAAELDNKRGAGLRASLELYQMGEVRLSDVMKQFQEAAEYIDDKNDPNSSEKLDPFIKARMDAILRDDLMPQSEKDQKILELRREAYGESAPASAPEPAADQGGEDVKTMSPRQLKKVLGKDALDSITTDASKVNPDRRIDFVVNRVSRLAAEKGLGDEQIADIAFSVLQSVE